MGSPKPPQRVLVGVVVDAQDADDVLRELRGANRVRLISTGILAAVAVLLSAVAFVFGRAYAVATRIQSDAPSSAMMLPPSSASSVPIAAASEVPAVTVVLSSSAAPPVRRTAPPKPSASVHRRDDYVHEL